MSAALAPPETDVEALLRLLDFAVTEVTCENRFTDCPRTAEWLSFVRGDNCRGIKLCDPCKREDETALALVHPDAVMICVFCAERFKPGDQTYIRL